MIRYVVTMFVVGSLALCCHAGPKDPENPTGDIRDTITKVVQYKLDRNDVNLQPMKCWVADDQCEPLELPLEGKNKTPVKVELPNPIGWLEPFYVAKVNNIYSLIVRSDNAESIDEYVGWVPNNRLIMQPQALRDPDTKIYYKAMIVNTATNLDQNAIEKGAVSATRSPDAAGKSSEEPARLFGIYFVYTQTNDYILLGGRETFNPNDGGANDAKKTVIGWVKKDRLVEWNTRNAVEWNYRNTLPSATSRRTTAGKIYRTPDAALADADGKATLGPKDVIAVENFNMTTGESVQLRFDDMRYPLLKWQDIVPKDRSEEEFLTLRNGQLRRVGVIGGFKGNAELSAEQLKQLQDVFTSLQTQVRETEILFVVDDTESMSDWFSDVAKVVRQINQSVQGDPNRVVRISLTYYNDITLTSKAGAQPWDGKSWELRNIKEVGEEIAKSLESHQVQDGGDQREMVYRGIIDSVDKSKFSDYARKMVIVVGDAGDRDPDDVKLTDPKSAIRGYSKAYNIEKVIERLTPEKKVPFELYAFQVNDPILPGAAAFRQQMLEIRDGLIKKSSDSDGEVFKGTEQTELNATIKKRFAKLQERADSAEQAAKEGARGQFNSSLLSPGMEAIIADKLKELNIPGLDIEKLKTLKGFQLFEVGYVWEKLDNEPLITSMLFLDDDGVKAVADMLTRLESPDRTRRPDLKELIVNLAQTMAGEAKIQTNKIDQGTLNDVVQKSLGIEFASSFFKTKIAELDGPGLQSAPKQSEYYSLIFKRDLLSDLRARKLYDYEDASIQTGGTSTQRVKQRKQSTGQERIRDFPLPGAADARYYWIDQEREFP